MSFEGILDCKIVAFNRTPRIKYTIELNFEEHHWKVEHYYSDFVKLAVDLESSQYSDVASGLPPKHDVGMLMAMKFKSKRSAAKYETPFIRDRMAALEKWTRRVLQHIGPVGLDEVNFLDLFFEAFSPDQDPSRGHVDESRSIYHILKTCRISPRVYAQLWRAGYTFDTLRTIERQKWEEWGVAIGSIEQLETKLHGLRHKNYTTMMGPGGQVTQIETDAVTGQMRRVNSVSSSTLSPTGSVYSGPSYQPGAPPQFAQQYPQQQLPQQQLPQQQLPQQRLPQQQYPQQQFQQQPRY